MKPLISLGTRDIVPFLPVRGKLRVRRIDPRLDAVGGRSVLHPVDQGGEPRILIGGRAAADVPRCQARNQSTSPAGTRCTMAADALETRGSTL